MNAITTHVERITHEIAQELLRLNTRNVPLRETVIKQYAAQMAGGGWKLTGHGISISDDGVLIDGQHLLHAIVRSGVTVEMNVTRGLSYDETFDCYDAGKTRSSGEILALCAAPNASYISSAIRQYDALLTGRVTRPTKFAGLTNHEIVENWEQNRKLWTEINDGLANTAKKCSFLPSSVILGVAFYLVKEKRHSVEKVTDFFTQLYTGQNIENDTIRVLRERLIQTKLKGYVMTPQTRLGLLVKTWNYFVKGKEVSQLVISEADKTRAFL